VLLAALFFYPILSVFVTSFFKSGRETQDVFVGFMNYHRLIHDVIFRQVIYQTFICAVSTVGIATAISLGAALLLNRSFLGRNLARVCILLTWSIAPAILALTWRYIYSGEAGPLNYILRSFGIIRENIWWLSYPSTTFPAVIWVIITTCIPFTTLGILGALQGISPFIYESAEIDGASIATKFWFITFPLLKPVFIIVTLFNVIYVFRSFPIVWVLTRGGPVHFSEILGTYIYKTAFTAVDWGLASAISIIGFSILMIFIIIFNKLTFKEGLQ